MNISSKNKLMYEGKVFESKGGLKYKILEVIDSKNIKIEFLETNNVVWTNATSLKKGYVKDHYHKSVCGIGYIGVGCYSITDDRKIYNVWHDVILRIYDLTSMVFINNPTAICDEWLNFQNFAEWYDSNYYEVDGEKSVLCLSYSKDNVLSEETAIILPQSISRLFRGKMSNGENRYRNTSFSKRNNKYCSYVYFKGKRYSLGYYDTDEEANKVAMLKKSELFQNLLEEYKDKIPTNFYNKLLTVDINEF